VDLAASRRAGSSLTQPETRGCGLRDEPAYGIEIDDFPAPIILAIMFFVLGGFAVTAQAIFLREFLVVFLGNELSLGLILSTWLLGVAFGAWIGTRISGRLGRLAHLQI